MSKDNNGDYYLVFKTHSDRPIHIGVISMMNFWPERGWSIINTIVNDEPDILNDIIIKNDKNQEITLDKFIKIISKLKIKTH